MPTTDKTNRASESSTDSQLERTLTERILHSETFRGAQTLRHLLAYLTDHADGSQSGALKEYSLGVDALGRRPDFDPKIDPIVRVQMRRLRQKLEDYYASEGASDPLVLEIPKGQYTPVFRRPVVGIEESPNTSALDESSEALVSAPPASPNSSAGRRPFRLPAGWGGIAVAFGCGLVVPALWIGLASPGARPVAPAEPVQRFWSEFLGKDKAPVIGYPDAVFLLDNSNDLFSFRQGATDNRGALVNPEVIQQDATNPDSASKAGPLYYENGYTGTGELQSAAMLSGLFARMGVQPTLKSSRDITTADLEQHNVILLGSSFQNMAVAQFPRVGDFVFTVPDSPRGAWRGQIVNLHPGANEQLDYQTQRDAETGMLKADYGLISVFRGTVPGMHIAILGGLDTTGTQGATRFATSAESLPDLEDAMAALSAGKSYGFQAVLRIDLQKGYEVLNTGLVSLHRIPNPRPSTPSTQISMSQTRH